MVRTGSRAAAWARAWSMALFIVAAGAHAQSVNQKPAEQGLKLAAEDVARASDRVSKAERDRIAAEAAAERAHQALLAAVGQASPQLKMLSETARRLDDDLDLVNDEVARAKRALVQARRQLVQAAADFDQCGKAGPVCRAEQLAASRESASASPVAERDADAERTRLILAASGAIKQAGEVRQRTSLAFAAGDGAVADLLDKIAKARAVLKNKDSTSEEREAAEKSLSNLRTLLQQASEARNASFDAYDAREGTMKAANVLVEEGLKMAKCAEPSCPSPDKDSLVRAQRAARLLNERNAESTEALKTTRAAAVQVQVGIEYPPGDRAQAALFKALIDSNPDARSVLGGNAYRIAANGKGAEASIRIDLDQGAGSLLRDTALILSSPVAKDGPTEFVSSADGLANATYLKFARTALRGYENKDRLLGYLYHLGYSVRLGQTRHEWRDVAALDKKINAVRDGWSVGAHLAYGGVDDRTLHLLKLDYTSNYKDKPARVVCPAVPVAGASTLSCVQAAFEPPSRKVGRLLSYEYRYRSAKGYGISPRFEYDHESGIKELSLPIYLIPTADEKQQLTGGISWTRVSRSRDPSSTSNQQLTVFVSGPFSLWDAFSK